MTVKKSEQEIIEGLKPLCICKGIRKRTVLEKIAAGCCSVEEIRKATGAGSGSCKGERCTPRIEKLLKKNDPAKE